MAEVCLVNLCLSYCMFSIYVLWIVEYLFRQNYCSSIKLHLKEISKYLFITLLVTWQSENGLAKKVSSSSYVTELKVHNP